MSKTDQNQEVIVRLPRWIAQDLSEAAWEEANAMRRAIKRLAHPSRPAVDRVLERAASAAADAMDDAGHALWCATTEGTKP